MFARYRANFLGTAGDVPLIRHYRSVTGFEAACLLAFGLAAFLAGLVLAGQLVAVFGSDGHDFGRTGLCCAHWPPIQPSPG